MERTIRYRNGYKYQLAADYVVHTTILPHESVDHEFIYLTSNGVLAIKKGYAWDGCSGPTWDDNTNLRASLVHDALYQLMRHKLLDLGWRETVDRQFQTMCREDGMGAIRAWYYYHGVRLGGEAAAKWQDELILVAP